ncbi:chlorophyll a/b-binding protein [Prochlorococcus sp. MIT 1223]|uniref:chlorophyll a/b-binding protein n=1 Tax=Prochlorococcus sp. MIT 1223 TaxID=3096217 RepID=UPI002A75F999|nr:chlorophyll a/b-binding protein [Prochlorococcus sp. MIT 1223]
MLEESKKTLKGTPSATTTDVPSFGWSNYAERINGRFAMIGFIFILFIELLSNKGFLFWSGFLN